MTAARRALVVAVIAMLAGCDDDAVDPITRITGPRVLAIVTEPSTLALGGASALTAVTVDVDGPRGGVGARPVDAVRMRACAPWTFVADPDRDCVGADALVLVPDGDGRMVATAAALEAAFPSPPGTGAPGAPWGAALAAGLTLRVPIIAEVEVDGQTLVARRDLLVVDASVADRNPAIAEIRFDGVATRTLRSGQRYALTVTVDPASLDPRPGAEPPSLREPVDCSFYSPTGELADRAVEIVDPDAPVPESAPIAYTAGAPGPTWLFVVANDQTGGMSVVSLPLVVE